MAGVHEMIAKLPDGYTTYISPTSNALSAGQRQRIALARAFYSEPKVLILDEPNAHLDQISEKILLEVLANARAKGVAVLIVSQRRSVLKIANHAMVIEAGKNHFNQSDPQQSSFQPQEWRSGCVYSGSSPANVAEFGAGKA